MKPIAVTDKTFKQETASGAVLVDFWASWCGPCRMLVPILDDLGNLKPDLKIVKVNTDENNSTADAFGITSLPTIVLLKNGQEVARHAGMMPLAKLRSFVGT
jgi:thioredoxin 1